MCHIEGLIPIPFSGRKFLSSFLHYFLFRICRLNLLKFQVVFLNLLHFGHIIILFLQISSDSFAGFNRFQQNRHVAYNPSLLDLILSLGCRGARCTSNERCAKKTESYIKLWQIAHVVAWMNCAPTSIKSFSARL